MFSTGPAIRNRHVSSWNHFIPGCLFLNIPVFVPVFSSGVGELGKRLRSESEPEQPVRVLLHHPPSAAGPGVRRPQLSAPHRHGACRGPQTDRHGG